MKHHPWSILCDFDNPTLTRVIEEQIIAQKMVVHTADSLTPPDCVVYSASLYPPSRPPSYTCPSLAVPRGSVRVGDIIDKIRYALSKRENHIDDEGVVLSFGDYTLLPSLNQLRYNITDTVIALTDKERLLLRTLYEAGEEGITRQNILQAVWGYAKDAETHTLETHLYRLRQKIAHIHDEDIIKVQGGLYSLYAMKS